ncbi:MAG: hypothetical protein ABSA78_08710 [Candidatus Sulfotelmatobacter sp.]|jgi:hypothetical protein
MTNVSHNSTVLAYREVPARAHDLTAAMQMLSHRIQGQLGSGGQTAFFIGDGLQRALTDSLFDTLLPQTWSPGNLSRLGSQLVNQSARLSRLLAPTQARFAWQELTNKAEVFALVRNLSSILNLPEGKFFPLADLVQKAYARSPFEALWAVEGVGHYYADEYWKRQGPPSRLLADANLPVPAKSLLMLHAGMGLCFADRLVGDLTTESTPVEVRDALEQFVALCRENSRQGYLGAAIESLGIVTRDFYPDLLKPVTQQFRFVAPEFTGFYWHGIGRAIYFSRKFFIPRLFSMWSDVSHEAAAEPDRQDVMAGLTWAFTLVNMRQPAIAETALRSHDIDSSLGKAFSNGVCSCIVMRTDTTPDEPFVPAFYEHRPSELASEWERRISKPASTAVRDYYPVLCRHSALDQVFRYQNLGELVERLHAQSEPAFEGSSTSTASGCCE